MKRISISKILILCYTIIAIITLLLYNSFSVKAEVAPLNNSDTYTYKMPDLDLAVTVSNDLVGFTQNTTSNNSYLEKIGASDVEQVRALLMVNNIYLELIPKEGDITYEILVSGKIYQRKSWPRFTWNMEKLAQELTETSFLQGKMLGKMQSLGFDFRQETLLQALTSEITQSGEIEGEHLNHDEVLSDASGIYSERVDEANRPRTSNEQCTSHWQSGYGKFNIVSNANSALTVRFIFSIAEIGGGRAENMWSLHFGSKDAEPYRPVGDLLVGSGTDYLYWRWTQIEIDHDFTLLPGTHEIFLGTG